MRTRERMRSALNDAGDDVIIMNIIKMRKSRRALHAFLFYAGPIIDIRDIRTTYVSNIYGPITNCFRQPCTGYNTHKLLAVS